MHSRKLLLVTVLAAAASCFHAPFFVLAQDSGEDGENTGPAPEVDEPGTPEPGPSLTPMTAPTASSDQNAEDESSDEPSGADGPAAAPAPAPVPSTVSPASPTIPEPTPTATEEGTADDSSTTTIALGSLLGAMVLGNLAVCVLLKAGYFKRKKKGNASLDMAAAPSSAVEEGYSASTSRASPELVSARSALAAERSRREYAEAIIARAKPGGLRVSDFPNVRDVVQHVEQLADVVLSWTSKACAIGGSNSALPATLQSIVVQTYVVCTEEVTSRLDDRMQSLSVFLGSGEPVTLSGNGSMNLDTQYVLYEVLSKNYKAIVPVEGDDIRRLANSILEQCGARSDEVLAENMVFGDAWSYFEVLVKSYVMLFVECALQNPPMTFLDDLGKVTTFDPVVHREWAYFASPPAGNQCSIVLPALAPQAGRSRSFTKAGAVRIHP